MRMAFLLSLKKNIMKTIYIIVLLFSTSLFAQFKVDTIQKNVSYSKIFEAKDFSVKTIHDKSKEWLAMTYKDVNSVLELDTDSKMIGHGVFNADYKSGSYNIDMPFEYDIIISIKEGRYKLEFLNYKALVQGNEYPVENYLVFKEDDLLDLYKKQLAESKDMITRAAFKSQMKPKKIAKRYKDSKISTELLISQFKQDAEQSAESLFNYIKTKEDW